MPYISTLLSAVILNRDTLPLKDLGTTKSQLENSSNFVVYVSQAPDYIQTKSKRRGDPSPPDFEKLKFRRKVNSIGSYLYIPKSAPDATSSTIRRLGILASSPQLLSSRLSNSHHCSIAVQIYGSQL